MDSSKLGSVAPADRDRHWQLDAAKSAPDSILVARTQTRDVPAQRFDKAVRQHGNAIFHALGVANDQLPLAKIDVLDPKMQCLEQPQTAAIQETPEQPMATAQVAEHGALT